MMKARNKQIAKLVLQGRTYDSVGIEYDISRERVYQITRRICERIDPKVADKYDIKGLRKDSDRFINKIDSASEL